ncbi:hypothetical protein LX32DRAFT_358610 [Colletotrichum zoysiae]|uniref:Uncharacterized protein n=1 Tax=Colletotrichum zoysiae TaxID=1216348 RepID=A0AAD9HJH4_9PEZI|nr:hypothetical protein LX32DRAFT_358610 [Colletotrichum zoysiae]
MISSASFIPSHMAQDNCSGGRGTPQVSLPVYIPDGRRPSMKLSTGSALCWSPMADATWTGSEMMPMFRLGQVVRFMGCICLVGLAGFGLWLLLDCQNFYNSRYGG